MRRRRALAAIGATGIAGVAGTASYLRLTDSDRDFGVDGDEPTVNAPGETTVTVRAGDVASLHFTEHCYDSKIEFGLRDATVNPRPDATYQSFPPTWTWERRRDVTVRVPVTVPADATGRCEYAVTATGGDDETVEESFAITVDVE